MALASVTHRFSYPYLQNRSNFDAHFEGTGPEIWRQTDGKVDAFVAGAGEFDTPIYVFSVFYVMDVQSYRWCGLCDYHSSHPRGQISSILSVPCLTPNFCPMTYPHLVSHLPVDSTRDCKRTEHALPILIFCRHRWYYFWDRTIPKDRKRKRQDRVG